MKNLLIIALVILASIGLGSWFLTSDFEIGTFDARLGEIMLD
ncbi:hypothetical protein [Robertmurraya korlensis]|nr:hypothetical protein [Robertmurraya korlensis]